MLSFEEKVMVLASIRAIGINKTVSVFSKVKRVPPVIMREKLDIMSKNHYLLNDGIVEKTQSDNIQYTEFRCPQQPTILTQEYFDTCKEPLQNAFTQALNELGLTNFLRTFKPKPIIKKIKYAQEENHQTSS